MAQRARFRKWADESPFDLFSDWAPATCMTGDGGALVPPTHLCRDCRARPYGTVGAVQDAKDCKLCWKSHYVWLGNSWGLEHIGSFDMCEHECHADEIWFA
jgi:hypothetical protein